MGGTTEANPFRPFVRIICVGDGRGFLGLLHSLHHVCSIIEGRITYEYRESDEGAEG
ncbi:hypothetical protein D3C73_1318490 [compost metagenome]